MGTVFGKLEFELVLPEDNSEQPAHCSVVLLTSGGHLSIFFLLEDLSQLPEDNFEDESDLT